MERGEKKKRYEGTRRKKKRSYLTTFDAVKDLGMGVPFQAHGAGYMLWVEEKAKYLGI